jgi:hypothetical protein
MPNSNEAPEKGTTVLDAAKAMTDLKDISDEFLDQIASAGNGDEEGDEAPATDAQDTEEQPAEKPADGEESSAPAKPAGEEGEADEAVPPQPKPEDTVKVLNPDGSEETVTRKEAMQRGLRQQDYTRKTQELAEHRKTLAQERAETAEQRRKYGEGLDKITSALKALTTEPDWETLRSKVTPEQFTQAHADWTQRKARIDALDAEFHATVEAGAKDRTAEMTQRIENEAHQFAAAAPDFLDEGEVGVQFREGMYKAAENIGFTREMVDQTVDHRLLILLDKARRFDIAQAKIPKPGAPKVEAPKPGAKPAVKLITKGVAAPGAASGAPAAETTKVKAQKEAFARNREEGTLESAAHALSTLDDLPA